MIKKFLLLLVISISFDVYAGAQSVPLLDPAPVAVPAATSAIAVEKAILGSGVRRKWDVIDRKPGEVRMRYAARGFSVTIKVLYDSNNVTIKYVDSENLQYSEGDTVSGVQVGQGGLPMTHPSYNRLDNQQHSGGVSGVPVIHPNYNRWVSNLAHDISDELMLGSIK